MREFEIKGEFIMLNKFLKAAGIVGTGGHAKMMVEDGEVIVNDEVEFRLRNKLRPGAIVKVAEETILIKGASSS